MFNLRKQRPLLKNLLVKPLLFISNCACFTLIAPMVVIVILGVLVGLVLPRIIDQPDKARVIKARMQMESISMGLKQYTMDNGFSPATEQGLYG